MENTKDLVRAERRSRFVCRAKGVGGRLQLPDPRSPCSSLTPLPGPFLHPTPPQPSGAPLPLPAVKRFKGGGSPPPTSSAPHSSGFSLRSLHTLWRKTFGRKFSLRPVPSPFSSGWWRGGGALDL